MSTQWNAMRERLMAEYGVNGLPERTTTTAVADVEPGEPPVRREGRRSPSQRQSAALQAARLVRSDSWWMTCGRENFTQRCEREFAGRESNDLLLPVWSV